MVVYNTEVTGVGVGRMWSHLKPSGNQGNGSTRPKERDGGRTPEKENQLKQSLKHKSPNRKEKGFDLHCPSILNLVIPQH